MKPNSLIFLLFYSLSAAATNLKQRQILGPPASATSTGATATSNPNPPAQPTDSNPAAPPASTSGTDTGLPTQGLPSISGPSLPVSTSSTTSSSTSSSTTGSTSTSTLLVTSSDTSTSTSSSSSTAPSPSDTGSDSTPVGTGTIVGLSVAGGIAVLGAIAFIIWKVTRKRFSEFDADGEEIKWPELGHESHALPTRPTGRVGVDDDGYDDAGVGDAGRHLGNYAPSTTTGEASMADLNSYNDPYAVPPLPHLDPNQTYHDDPSNYGGHYDPYHGPVPQSFHDPASADRMSSRSPAPVNYGRQSPGPSLGYQRPGY